MEHSERAFITEEDVRSYLRIDDDDDPSLHEAIVILINSICDAIETATNRKYVQYEHTWIRDGNGQSTMFTRYRPVIGTPTVYFYDGDSWEEVSATYNLTPVVDPVSGKIYFTERYATFPEGTMNIKLVYNCGYADADSVPTGVKLAAQKLVGLYLNETRNARQGVKSETVEGMTSSFEYSSWPDDVKRLLGIKK